MTELRRIWVLSVATFMLAGCMQDEGPLGPDRVSGGPEFVQSSLSCRADLKGGAISCAPTDPALGGGVSGALLGEQGTLLQLESSNVSYDEGSEVFSAAVTVRNYLSQVLGSADGVTADPEGVRVFFVNAPLTTGGSGVVTVRNSDGTAEFTTAGQPYFQYSEVLSPGKRTLPKTWEWDVPATVESFTFVVGVSAKVANEADIAPGSKFIVKTVSTDTAHTCVLDITGQAYCWGLGGGGRLGYGQTTEQATPVPVAGGHRFVSVDVGLDHACGVTADGDAYCWGAGSSGRLGTGTTTSSSIPVKVIGGHKFIQVEAGRQFTCGLDTEGRIICWGFGGNGKLGNGSTSNNVQPAEVLGGHRFTWLSTGSYLTCGIATTGESYCWGSASNGKVGNGATSGNVTTPELVLGDHEFTSIYAGFQHTCALTAEGEAYCWGANGDRQLGDGTDESRSTPVPVQGGHRFVSLSLGSFHTCGVADTGKAYCWGNNQHGRLGLGVGADDYMESPAQVVEVEGFTSIATGVDHTCGATAAGQVYCWGSAGTGFLGTGSSTDTATPTQVTTLSGIAFLGAPPAFCGTAPEVASECFPRRSLRERILMALEPNGQRAADLS